MRKNQDTIVFVAVVLAAAAIVTVAFLAPSQVDADRSVAVGELASIPPYDREAFRHWIKWDNGGCMDVRHAVLLRDALHGSAVLSEDSCRVVSGKWRDPLSGVVVTGPANKMDVDHIISLVEAWESGAWTWDDWKRQEFANDPRNLQVVTEKSNRRKGGLDISDRRARPENPEEWCRYFGKWVSIKEYYGLDSDPAEVETLIEHGSCIEAGR